MGKRLDEAWKPHSGVVDSDLQAQDTIPPCSSPCSGDEVLVSPACASDIVKPELSTNSNLETSVPSLGASLQEQFDEINRETERKVNAMLQKTFS